MGPAAWHRGGMESRGRRLSEARTPQDGGPVPGLHVRYATAGLPAAAAFAAAVARAVGDAARGLDVAIAPDGVEFRLAAPGAGPAVPGPHAELARTIDEVAAAHGLAADTDRRPPQAAEEDGASAFWAALLGGDDDGPPRDRAPGPDARRLPGEPATVTGARWHLDLWLPPDVAPRRIAAALAAGGRVVDDDAAPTYTVLADPDGYLACVCTVDEAGPRTPG